MDELKNIMDAVCPIIQKRLNYTDSVFAVWFSELVLAELTEENAIFHTKSKLKQKILTTKYATVVREALSEVIGFGGSDLRIRWRGAGISDAYAAHQENRGGK